MGSKGSKTSTSTSNSTTTATPDAQAADLYRSLLQQAQNVSATPYSPYGGELVAPVNQQQSLGIAGINSNANWAQPYFTSAANQAQAASQPLTQYQIQQYLSPYTKNVVDATQAQFNNQNQQQQQQLLGNAISQGALGGNRVGVAQANLAGQQQLAQAPVIAGLLNQGYQNAVGVAQQQQQNQLSGAYTLGALGGAGQNAALTGANAQIGAGTLQQQTQQAADSAAYEQYLQQLAYPFQTTQWLAGLGTGVGSQLGGTTTSNTQGTQTQPGPSGFSQVLGGITGVGGLLGQSGAFGAAGWLTPFLARGGGVGRADGGAVGIVPTVPESPDTLRAQQSQLLAGDRGVQMFPSGTSELPLPPGLSRTEGVNGVFHHAPGISPDLIQGLSAEGRENELLDLGPYSKAEIMQRISQGEAPLVIVERTPDGIEVRAAVGTQQTAPEQIQAMEQTKSKGNTVSIEDVGSVLTGRSSAPRFAGGGGVDSTPRSIFNVPSWIPSIGVTPGRGAPAGAAQASMPQMQQTKAPDYTKQFEQVGGLAKDIYGSLNAGSNYGNGLPFGEDKMYYGDAASGVEGITTGYAAGGAPTFDERFTGDTGPTFDERFTGVVGREPDFSERFSGIPYGEEPKFNVPFTGNDFLSNGLAPATLEQASPALASTSDVPLPVERPPVAVDGVPVPRERPVEPAEATGLAAGPPLPPERPVTGREALPPARTIGLQTPTAGYSDSLSRYLNIIKGMESSGDYGAIGPPSRTGDRAYGAYQIMGANIPQWTQEVLGRPMTPAQFLADRNAQDTVARAKFGQYVNKYGPEGASKAWLAGEKGMNNPNAADALGTTVAQYANKFMTALNGGEPTGVASPTATADNGVLPANAQPTQQPGNRFDWSANNKLWPALTAAGFAMLASESPFPGVAIGQGGLAGMQQYGAERAREAATQKLMLDERRVARQEARDEQLARAQQEELRLRGLPYTGALTGAEKIRIAIEKEKLDEAKRAHDLALRAPVKIGQRHDGTERFAIARPGPNGIDYYEIDQDGNVSPTPLQPQGGWNNPLKQNQGFGPGASGGPGGGAFIQTQYNPDEGIITHNNKLLRSGGVDYSNTDTIPPVIEKGMDVPEPTAVGGKTPSSIKTDAEYYLQTGKLPPVRSGRSPVAIQQANYRNAVQNYANALASSRGVTPEQLSAMWRQAPGMLRFVLGADGRATVSLGTAVRHLDTVGEYAKAWAANDIQTVNRLRGMISREFGKDAASNLEAVGKIVGPEIVKAIGVAGAGTADERSAVEKQFSTAASPAQIFGAIHATQKLLAGQLEGKRRQAMNAGVPETQFRSLIGERPYEILSSLEPGGKPERRTQNGYIYEKQADGNWKAVGKAQ